MPRVFLAFLLGCFLACTALGQEQEISVSSPDQKRQAVAIKRQIKVRDAQTGRDLLAIQAHTADIVALAYSPDGKLLASADNGGKVHLFEIASGKQLLSVATKLKGNGKLVFEKDGVKLRVELSGVLKTIDIKTGNIDK